MQTISIQDLHERMPLGETATLIDVRTAGEYASGHVPGAKNIPLDTIPNHAQELSEFEEIFLICQSGGRSMNACMFLEQMGVQGVVNVLGGTTAWAALYDVE